MENNLDMYQVLDRAHHGEYCTSKDWDLKKVRLGVKDILKKYHLEKVCDPNNPVQTDYELADTFYKAGYELALRLGYFCEDTERIIKVSQEELDNALKFAPSELFLGEGKDGTLLKSRTPADPYPVKVACSLGITVSEDIYMKMVTGIAKEREVDILEAGSLVTTHGYEVLSGTPWETLMGHDHGRMHQQCRRDAGRPGMAAIGSISAVTDFGQFGAYGSVGGFSKHDLALILFPSEMKIDYRTLNKVIHTMNHDGLIFCASPSMIGGMPGPAEGAVVAEVACAILSYPILHTHVGGGEIYDVRYLANTNREGLWTLSTTAEALSRNMHIIVHNIANEVNGPGTENFLYEITAGMATLACTGASFTTGPRAAGGKAHDHITPLECRYTAEVTHAASGLEPKVVNEIVKQLLPKYEDTIKTPDLGDTFQHLYNLDTMQPIAEWEAIYRKVKKEAIELGIPMDPY